MRSTTTSATCLAMTFLIATAVCSPQGGPKGQQQVDLDRINFPQEAPLATQISVGDAASVSGADALDEEVGGGRVQQVPVAEQRRYQPPTGNYNADQQHQLQLRQQQQHQIQLQQQHQVQQQQQHQVQQQQHQQPEGERLSFSYHDYDQMTAFLRATASKHSDLTALYSIGKSVQGRDLWVMVVSASPYEHMIGKPDVKYIGNMHGNEAVSRELLLHLISHFVTSYHTDPYIRWLLDNTRIHIMPSMNPDGFEVSKEGTCEGGQGRYNSRGFDLNRNFPDYFKQYNKRTQPETEAVKEWISKIQFVVSGSLHGGALVASYPFDNTPNSLFQSYSSTPSLTPDDDVFKHLALIYSTNHAKMSRGVACKPSDKGFPRGITNGAEWYPLTGGMQDFNYVWHGCMEVTLEVSCCKFPPAHELPKYWEDNKIALIKFLAEAHRGVQGFVMDENGNPVEKASLKIKNRDVGFQTTKYGEFWRVLLPGVYKLEVYADGFVPKEVDFMVIEQHPTLLNVTLLQAKPGQKYRPLVTSPPITMLIPANAHKPVPDGDFTFPQE